MACVFSFPLQVLIILDLQLKTQEGGEDKMDIRGWGRERGERGQGHTERLPTSSDSGNVVLKDTKILTSTKS